MCKVLGFRVLRPGAPGSSSHAGSARNCSGALAGYLPFSHAVTLSLPCEETGTLSPRGIVRKSAYCTLFYVLSGQSIPLDIMSCSASLVPCPSPGRELEALPREIARCEDPAVKIVSSTAHLGRGQPWGTFSFIRRWPEYLGAARHPGASRMGPLNGSVLACIRSCRLPFPPTRQGDLGFCFKPKT